MREMTVAVVQMAPVLNSLEENLVQMADYLERICTEQKVDLVIFPELATTGYECGVRFTDLAERVPGHSVNLIGRRASEFGVYVAFGMVVKERVESILYNALVLLGPEGDLVTEYRKVHLRGEERLAFRPGYRFTTVDTEFGTLGLALGWDLAFPEAARSLALEGAELLVVSAAWEEPHADEWHTYLRARALENTVFVAGCNRVGDEPSYSFFGQSAVVGPDGDLRTVLDEPIQGYAVARLELDQVRQRREESQILQCRQPQAYRAIVKKY
ncbi:MAG: carbon-nitrogen hydrolase family protein [Chloroflexi bacterium]|nr:carbon-nitrogen hydrolase family protein [Chloroflexota bacterium]